MRLFFNKLLLIVCVSYSYYLAERSPVELALSRATLWALAKSKLLLSTAKSQKPGILPSPGIPNVADPFILIHLPHLQTQGQ